MKILFIFTLISFFTIANSCQYSPSSNSTSSTSDYVSLRSICDENKSDKYPPKYNFVEVYELFFYPIRDKAKKITEIGISAGESLKMWEIYFPNATIYGIDIFEKTKLESKRIKRL